MAPKDATMDEVADVLMYGKLDNSKKEHLKTLKSLEALREVHAIVERAKILTAEAEAKYHGTKPTMTEARSFETSTSGPMGSTKASHDNSKNPAPGHNDATNAYDEMMESILSAATEGGSYE